MTLEDLGDKKKKKERRGLRFAIIEAFPNYSLRESDGVGPEDMWERGVNAPRRVL